MADGGGKESEKGPPRGDREIMGKRRKLHRSPSVGEQRVEGTGIRESGKEALGGSPELN